MNQSRLDHGSVVLMDNVTKQEVVILTGGRNDCQSENVILKSTEILIDGNWKQGKQKIIYIHDQTSTNKGSFEVQYCCFKILLYLCSSNSN